MKHLFTLKSLLLTLVMLCGLNAWGETPVYSLTFTKDTGNNAYAKAHNTTSDGVTWTVYGNQALGNYLAVGGKSLSNVGRTLTSQSAVSTFSISKITLNHGGINNTSLKINSITIEGSTVSNFKSDVKTATISSPSVSTSGSLDFALESDEWAANSYFRITVNCTNTKSSNYKLDIISVDFYAASGAVVVSAPTFSAANAADLDPNYSTLGEGTGEITMTSATVGATIYYSTTAEDATDFVPGTTFEGFKASSATDEGVKTIWAYAEKDGVKSTVASASYTFAQPQVATPGVTLDGTPEAGSDYLVGQTVKVTATCEEGAKLVYSYTNGDDYVELPAEGVNVTSEEVATINIYVKAIKENYKDSRYVKNSVNFVNPPKSVKFEQVTDALQLVAGAKYVITNASDTKIMLGYESGNNCKSENVEVSSNTLQIMDNFSGILTLGVTDGQKGYYLQQADGKYLNQGETGSNRLKAVVNLQDYSYWNIVITEEGEAQINNVKNTSKGVMQYNGTSGTSVFNCYESYNSNNGYERLHLYRMVEETTVGLKEVLDGNVGCKYHINCALRVNYTDDTYVYASTIGGGSKATTPTEVQKKEWWSDKEEKFNQNDWVAIDIQGFDVVEGAEIEAGRVATLVSNSEFPVIKFDSMKTADGTAIAANTYRVANFNIGNVSPLVSKLWLVAPQPAEYCKVKGYVDVADVKTNYLFAKTGSEATEIEGTSYEPLKMTVNLDAADKKITESGWYVFEGIVIKNGNDLELNAVNVNKGTATGVEGVETSSVKVYGAEGVINVESEEVAPIAVYSANGAIVSSVEASSASIAVAPGFYIVKAGNSVSKVTVK